jgi:hypothetical protein
MILKYFEPDLDFDFAYLDKATGKVEGMATWEMAGVLFLIDRGYEVVNITNFDYEKFAKFGKKYIQEFAGDEVAEEQERISDLNLEMERSKGFEKFTILKIPTVKDIKKYLNDDCLVMCEVNASVLDGKDDYEPHAILITDYDDKGFIIQDPGLPPIPNMFVEYEKFEKAWAYPEESVKNLKAIKLTK